MDEECYFLTICLWSSCVDVGHVGLENVNPFEREREFSGNVGLERLSHCEA